MKSYIEFKSVTKEEIMTETIHRVHHVDMNAKDLLKEFKMFMLAMSYSDDVINKIRMEDL